MAVSLEHFTPTIAELQPFNKINCQQVDCSATFTNAGNYELHLQRHHKLQRESKTRDDNVERLYYCPIADCIYNSGKGTDGRHFKHMKNLRQHFQKVHIKNFICERCGRAFPTQGQFKKHCVTSCGKRFICTTCNWDFETRDALILHGKRKGHTVENKAADSSNKELSKKAKKCKSQLAKDEEKPSKTGDCKDTQKNNKDTQTILFLPSFYNTINGTLCDSLTEYNDCETQTESSYSTPVPSNCVESNSYGSYQDIETQTISASNCLLLENFQALNHHDMETQTELTSLLSNSNCGTGFLDQMLGQAPLSHMHTQTCDDLLSELGLTDIQTQTNWSSFTEQMNKEETTSARRKTTTTGFAHDELLVSTETQTSFTQCLLDSSSHTSTVVGGHLRNDNGASCTNAGEESNASNYAHLYNTQHTQTCDLLLEGLFGGQENDLIGGFQSTYTQT